MATEFPLTRSESSSDRFGFTLFVSITAHALLIFGISFTVIQRPPENNTLEITLAQYETSRLNNEADFLAQANQQGSGLAEEAREITAPEQTPFTDTQQQEIGAPLQELLELRENHQRAQLSTSAQNEEKSNIIPEVTPQKDSLSPAPLSSDKQLQIANLKTRLDRLQQAAAKKPRIRRLTTVSTMAAPEAEYLFNWRQHIETVGNQNYPPEARQKKIYGKLRLAVILRPDGSVENIEILQSSGQRVLDSAAIRIVRMASPFKPLPREVLEHHDRLEIIRTWRFERGDTLQTAHR